MILIADLTCDPLLREEFVRPLSRIVEESFECEVLHHCRIDDELVKDYEKVILSGTALRDRGYLEDEGGFGWLKTYDKPVLGICAGMQVIGKVFGCKVTGCREVGMIRIKTVKENPLFADEFTAYTLHDLALEANHEFKVLARSGKCVQSIKHDEKPFYGVLFHPEARNKTVIHSFLN
ncbi:hypothetical protein ACFLRF_05935 [Candidatus Altiarchaeota archaeon]